MSLLQKLFGSNERQISKLQPIVDQVNENEEKMKALSDEGIKEKTAEFKKRLKDGESLDDIMSEAFALVREAARRAIGERHYDVQIMGGIVLHQGKIAEMKTGEGKTLTSTLPIYLNALEGKGVHVVTVNDYLAKRDCNWMGIVYETLGLKTACITHEGGFLYKAQTVDKNAVDIEMENLNKVEKKEAYAADITYGTNNEFGFDYLRDNMAQSKEALSQREHHYAIVDEVDSILIDEARTPLIISAPDTESTKLYEQFSNIVPSLKRGEDFTVDEKLRSVAITDKGIEKIEDRLNIGNIYEEGKIQYVHHLEQSLKAQVLFERDKDYLVRDGEVIIVDEFTGRAQEGRRYSDGLHQAIEAKEKVPVQRESRTLATVTFQNYFRMYDKLSGMTGTANTSAEEFQKVYELEVVEIPTNRDMQRKDLADVVYKNERGKFNAIVAKIKELNAKGQPVLVGTVAIEKSEALSRALEKAKVSHSVLNAKFHEKEAQIIADAGQKGAVTIATNMAGRGTDIKLGDGVEDLGGLYIIGTERHEARRIDNQLRGRSGRQGDAGTTQFYISLDDELMRRFGGDRLKGIMERLGLPEDQPIENKMISKQIEGAQSKIEGFNFDIRKHVLDYDNVVNKQREVIYERRREALEKDDVKSDIFELLHEDTEEIVSAHVIGDRHNWEVKNIVKDVRGMFPFSEKAEKKLNEIIQDESKDDRETVAIAIEHVYAEAKIAYAAKEKENGEEAMRAIEKSILFRTIDQHWMNHLDAIDHLRQGIGLRGYGQQDPLIEYKKEAFDMFSQLIANIRHTVLHTIFRASIVRQEDSAVSRMTANMILSGGESNPQQFAAAAEKEKKEMMQNIPKVEKPIKSTKTVGRNDDCPCGSGKKYKKCCGK
ncbi:MAG: preprotein translocase subunit SecA [Candidatus Moraniibacteriota bacterium]|nr:MAG: preprotein translocase subunit SecA [Candidatus Moranbacteria bacterium]